MKSREEMIYDLTKHELEFLFDMNGDFDDTVQFFANGGYQKYTDEKLSSAWQFQFTDDYQP
jgi:hypothetical protein